MSASPVARVEQDVLDKSREFDIEEAAAPLAKEGFKKLRTLKRMEDRYRGCVGGVGGTLKRVDLYSK